MAGNATGRAVSSMKAMLDPSMVAANTHGAALGVQADFASVERIIPSSQGCLITWAIGPYPRPGYWSLCGRTSSVCHCALHSRHALGWWQVAGLAPLRSVTCHVTISPYPPWRSRYIPQMSYFG